MKEEGEVELAVDDATHAHECSCQLLFNQHSWACLTWPCPLRWTHAQAGTYPDDLPLDWGTAKISFAHNQITRGIWCIATAGAISIKSNAACCNQLCEAIAII